MTKFVPHSYQEKAIKWVLEKERCALWLEMGLGKTVVALTAISELLDMAEVRRVLIVAPLRVAKVVWPLEIEKWDHTKWLNYSLILGSKEKRERAVKSSAPIHIINFDNIVWLVKHVLGKTKGKWPYDMVVIDESSFIKHQSSKRFKAIRHISPAVKRIVELTGSPADNGLLDLWSQIYVLDFGKRLGNTQKAMRDRWFEPESVNEYGTVWRPKECASGQIHRAVSDIALSMSAKDYLDMPPLIENPVIVRLPDSAYRVYEKMERDMWLELGDKFIEAVNGGVLTMKCRQVSNGFIYDEDKYAEQIHTAKLDALEEVINEAVGEPVLVAYQFEEDIKAITSRFKNAVVMDKEGKAVEKWNNGEIGILLAHPKSAGHGLNLQHGGNIIAMYGLDWSLQLYEQFVARLHRQGQEKPVIVNLILGEGTIDELIWMRVQAKRDTQSTLKDMVKLYQTTKYKRQRK